MFWKWYFLLMTNRVSKILKICLGNCNGTTGICDLCGKTEANINYINFSASEKDCSTIDCKYSCKG